MNIQLMAAGLVKERKNLKLIYQDGLDGDPCLLPVARLQYIFFKLKIMPKLSIISI